MTDVPIEDTKLVQLVAVGKLTQENAVKWEDLAKKAKSCEACSLHESCTNKVFGIGSVCAPFMFIGDSPTAPDDFRGEAFSSKTGLLFKKAMHDAGFQRGDAYLTNLVCCRAPKDRDPKDSEIGACFLRLWNQIEIIRPKVIVLIGSLALKKFAPKGIKAIGSSRGDVFSSYGYRMIPVWHPSYVLSSKSALRKKELEKDLKKAYYEVFAV